MARDRIRSDIMFVQGDSEVVQHKYYTLTTVRNQTRALRTSTATVSRTVSICASYFYVSVPLTLPCASVSVCTM